MYVYICFISELKATGVYMMIAIAISMKPDISYLLSILEEYSKCFDCDVGSLGRLNDLKHFLFFTLKFFFTVNTRVFLIRCASKQHLEIQVKTTNVVNLE